MVDSLLLTMEGLFGGVYELCGNPSEDVLKPSMVLEAIYNAITLRRNEMSLTDEGWDLTTFIINAQPNLEEYEITDPGFGRPYFAETYEPNNPRFRRREVKIARVQDRNIEAYAADILGSSKHNARVMFFYNIGTPVPKVQIYPVPRQACAYRVWTETIITQEPRYRDVPAFLAHFFPLIKTDACITVLPWCGFPLELCKLMIEVRRAEQMQHYDVFERYVQEIFHSDAQVMKAANSSRRYGRRRVWG